MRHHFTLEAKLLRVCAGALLLTFALAGCSGGDDDDDNEAFVFNDDDSQPGTGDDDNDTAADDDSKDDDDAANDDDSTDDDAADDDSADDDSADDDVADDDSADDDSADDDVADDDAADDDSADDDDDLPVLPYPCETEDADIICVGAAKMAITPPGYEQPKPEYLSEASTEEDPNRCMFTEQSSRCGALMSDYNGDCGSDRLCPFDEGYTEPDADGTERDGVLDFFRDCGFDHLCPGDAGYPGPDEGEGNGEFDGFWLAGFGDSRPMFGVKDDIWARTLVLHHKDKTIAYFVVDVVGFFHDDFLKVRDKFKEKYPQDRVDYIIGQATHSHEAPDTCGQWGPFDPESEVLLHPGVVETWMDWAIEQMADGIHEAYMGQRRAEMWAGQGITGVDGVLEDWRSPTIIDDKIMTMQFRDEEDGHVIATSVHWANHPESLWSRNNFVSSDYAHDIRTFLEDGLPARGDLPAIDGYGGIGIYMQGAVGGIMSTPGHSHFRDGTPTTFRGIDNTQAIGELVVDTAYNVISNSERITDLDGIRWVNRVHYLPVDNTQFQIGLLSGWFPRHTVWNADGTEYQFGGSLKEHPPYLQTEQAIVRIGPSVTWFTYPGELFPEFAVGGYDESLLCGRSGGKDCGYPFMSDESLKNPIAIENAPKGPYTEELIPGKYKWLLGLSMDFIGYIVPGYDYKLSEDAPYLDEAPGDHYEETNGIGPHSEETDAVMRDMISEAAALY